MIFLKNSTKILGKSYLLLIILTLLMTILNYFNIINIKVINILIYVIPFISFLMGGFLSGKQAINKGWLTGIKFGLLSTLSLILLNLIFNDGFTLYNIINYIIVMLGSCLGSIIGINKKINNK